MSCCGASPDFEQIDEVSRLVSTKLAAFLRTLRDNGFAVGPAEGQDAASLMASGYAARPGLLRSALKHLFSARKSDWEKFDGLFDAFWLGRRVRSRSLTFGAAKAANSPSMKSLQDQGSERGGSQSATDQVPSTGDAPEGQGGEGLMEGASRADNLAEVDFRKLADPEQVAQAHDAAARLARLMRTRLTRRDLARRRGYRLDLRRTIHRNISHGGVPIALVKRQRKDKPLRLVVLLDEHVHQRVPALHPGRARLISRGRGIPVSHEIGLRLRRHEGEGCRSRAGSLVSAGARRGRRDPDRREPEDLQPLARGARDPFPHLRDDRLRRLRDRRRRAARPRDGSPCEALPPHRLAQPDDGLGRLRTGCRRHQGGAAVFFFKQKTAY